MFQRASRFGRCSKKCPEVDAVPKHVQARFGAPMPPCGEASSLTLLSSGPMLVQGSGKVLPCPLFTSTLGDCNSRLPASASTTSGICRCSSPQLTSKALESGRRRFLPSRREVAAAIHVLVESCWNNNPLVPACVASSVRPSWFLTASPGIASLQVAGRASMLSS